VLPALCSEMTTSRSCFRTVASEGWSESCMAREECNMRAPRLLAFNATDALR
jgi:hypothetical protein